MEKTRIFGTNDINWMMNRTTCFLQTLLAMAFAGALTARAQTDHSPIVGSPDHPSTWVVGATRMHQNLRWSPEKQMLVADVVYSTENYADGPHPTQEDDFTLSFPTVHFDPASGRFTVKGVAIATLHHGLFGSSVILNPRMALSIHRHHGIVYGAIVPSLNED